MRNAEVHVSNLISEHTHNTGGTGLVLNTNKHIMRPEAQTNAFKQIRGEGRCDLYGLNYCKDTIAFSILFTHIPKAMKMPRPDLGLMTSAKSFRLKWSLRK